MHTAHPSAPLVPEYPSRWRKLLLGLLPHLRAINKKTNNLTTIMTRSKTKCIMTVAPAFFMKQVTQFVIGHEIIIFLLVNILD